MLGISGGEDQFRFYFIGLTFVSLLIFVTIS